MAIVVDTVARALRAEGVDVMAAYPTTPLIDAAVRAGIRPVLCRQERVGVGIADGYSRVRAGTSFGVFAMQFGPGAENAFPGIASAFADGIPLLLLPLGNALDRAQMRPLFRAERSYGAITNGVETVVRAGDAAEVMRRAVSRLRCGPGGPVMVEIPADVAIEEAPDGAPAYRPVTPARSAADPADVDRAVTALLGARRPMILAGAACSRPARRAGSPPSPRSCAFPSSRRSAARARFPRTTRWRSASRPSSPPIR